MHTIPARAALACVRQELLSAFDALTAAAGDAQPNLEITERARALGNAGFDLSRSYTVADTNVHPVLQLDYENYSQLFPEKVNRPDVCKPVERDSFSYHTRRASSSALPT
jgi:hypothetical protein